MSCSSASSISHISAAYENEKPWDYKKGSLNMFRDFVMKNVSN